MVKSSLPAFPQPRGSLKSYWTLYQCYLFLAMLVFNYRGLCTKLELLSNQVTGQIRFGRFAASNGGPIINISNEASGDRAHGTETKAP